MKNARHFLVLLEPNLDKLRLWTASRPYLFSLNRVVQIRKCLIIENVRKCLPLKCLKFENVYLPLQGWVTLQCQVGYIAVWESTFGIDLGIDFFQSTFGSPIKVWESKHFWESNPSFESSIKLLGVQSEKIF